MGCLTSESILILFVQLCLFDLVLDSLLVDFALFGA